MKTTAKALMMTLATAGTAWAASGAESEGNGLLVTSFLAFGALIIVLQLLPGLMLFGAMIKGLFISRQKTSPPGHRATKRRKRRGTSCHSEADRERDDHVRTSHSGQ